MAVQGFHHHRDLVQEVAGGHPRDVPAQQHVECITDTPHGWVIITLKREVAALAALTSFHAKGSFETGKYSAACRLPRDCRSVSGTVGGMGWAEVDTHRF